MLPLLLVLCGCGASTIDATNADTFGLTFGNMVADMPEAERVQLAQAVLAVRADARHDRVLPETLTKKRDIDGLLGPGLRHRAGRDIVLSIGDAIHGRTAAELLAMGADIVAEAARNAEVRDREHLQQRKTALQAEVAELAGHLAALRAAAEAAAAEEGRAREASAADLAVLDALAVSLHGQKPELAGGHVRNEHALTFANGTGQVVHDATYGFHWAYGDCHGYRHSISGARLLPAPLPPGASVSVEGQGGLGWTGTSIPAATGGHRCDLAPGREYRITAVETKSAAVGDPPRTVDRGALGRKLDRLATETARSRERVAAAAQQLADRTAALEAL